jgi:mRNA-degrading endonuclease toxin of MazEF toxin-antitoxin module
MEDRLVDFNIKNNRLDSWNIKKKTIQNKVSLTHNKNGSVKFRIKPWSIWWFNIGENIGTETGCHFTEDKISHHRPCIIISTNNFNNGSSHKKVMIMPLTSKKENTAVRHFHYELDCNNYQKYYDSSKRIKYLGLDKNSLVICNDIKTIDTKRLESFIYPELEEDDITNIKEFISKYFGV